MKRFAPLLALILVAACSSYDGDQPTDRRPPRGNGGYGGRGGAVRATGSGGGTEMLPMPPDDWWRDSQLATAVNLTGDQLTSLDKIAHDSSDEIARLERDIPIAARDLRTVLGAEKPAGDDITGAATRIRSLRDALFDRQAQLLAAERVLLTQQQWQTLEDRLQARRNERMDRGNGAYPRGGMGGRGGRGRFPG
jgi:Spy/CpxP family protein refolding chaperone